MNSGQEISLKLNPEKKGMEKFLGQLEAEVMDTVWANGSMTVKRAIYFIGKRRKYAYTTVMTIMNRLVEKSYLSRKKKGHSYIYSATMEKKSFLNFAVSEVVMSLLRDYQPITTKAYHNAKKQIQKSKPKTQKKKEE